MGIAVIKTTGVNPKFQQLIVELDKFTAAIDGAEFSFYAQFNKSLELQYVILLLENNEPIACGAFKTYDATTVEIKRMFVVESMRGARLAEQVLTHLEQWAKETGATRCILETGKDFISAVKLYSRYGYTPIERYGQYTDVDNSLCFEKRL